MCTYNARKRADATINVKHVSSMPPKCDPYLAGELSKKKTASN